MAVTGPPAASPGLSVRQLRLLQAVTLLLLIVPHWMVTRDLFDGALASFAELSGHRDGLDFSLLNANWLLAAWFIQVCFWLGDLLGLGYLIVVKLVISAMLLGLYHEFVRVGRELFRLDDTEARLVGLLCLASPSLYTLVSSLVVPNPLCFWLAFVGHRLFWSDKVHWRWLGLLVTAVSFQLNSNLVFVLALDVVYLYRFRPQRRQRLPWFGLLFLVAVAVYAGMRFISPPQQIYAQYNQLLNPFDPASLARLVKALIMFLTWGVIPISALLMAGLAAAVLRRGFRQSVPDPKPVIDRFVPLAAAFLCAAAIFPYVMVGKGTALFTWVSIGNGITEQVLRAVYAGPFAPTWANSSGRHGLLFSIPLGWLAWSCAKAVLQRQGLWRRRIGPGWLYVLILPLFLVWVLPAYRNKLEMQFAEISLVKGFKVVPAAPAGVVDLRFSPAPDWLFWSSSGSLILREAWASSAYFAVFHQTDGWRDDLLWQYHALFLAPGGLSSALVQHSMAMDGYPGADCYSRYEARIPVPGSVEVWFSGWRQDAVPAAAVRLLASDCKAGRGLTNPTPLKRVIP